MKTRPISDLLKHVAHKRDEGDVQASVVEALKTFGFLVLETSERRRATRCPHCTQMFTPSEGRGTTPGVPDLLVTHASFPRYLLAGLEIKGPRTAVSPAQRHLEETGRIVVIRSAEAALQVMREIQEELL